jgi:hypothetical protein
METCHNCLGLGFIQFRSNTDPKFLIPAPTSLSTIETTIFLNLLYNMRKIKYLD